MHAWHDIYVDDHLIEKAFPVVIEVPMGSKNKYELDKETGLLKLDRVLYPPTTGSFRARSAKTATRSTPWCSARKRSCR
jgi:inorganic pyrophosphatase